MTAWKATVRGGADRALKPYFTPLEDDIDGMKRDIDALRRDIETTRNVLLAVTDEVRGLRESADTRFDHHSLRLQQIFDEVDGVRGASEARLDHHSLRLQQIVDEIGGARGATEARLDHHSLRLQQIFDEVDGVRGASEARLDHHSLRLQQIFDEVDGVRGATEARLDHHSLRLQQILDEVGGARERVDRLDGRFGEVEASLVHQLEGQAQRQVELRSGFNELRQGMEKLELLFLAQLEGLFGAVHAEAAAVRKELVEVTRMLRMQGDAADQVAEVMGRTFERLSDEVLTLSETLGRLGLDTKEATAPA